MSTTKRQKEQRQKELQKAKAQRQYQKSVANSNLDGGHARNTQRKTKAKIKESHVTSANYRETKHYPSNESAESPTATARRQSTFYTGDFLVGLSTLHKSNSVPVTKDDDPTIFATMRRN